jgi:hypothetical protein
MVGQQSLYVIPKLSERRAQGTNVMKARIIVLQITGVIALYVLASMAAALARFPGQEVNAKGGYRHDATAAADEMDEVLIEHFLP